MSSKNKTTATKEDTAPALVPKLRFPGFQNADEWMIEALGQLADYENGKAYEQDIVGNGKYVVVNSRFISTDGAVRKYTNADYLIAKVGEVLMVLSDLPKGRALAKCYFVESNDRYAVNQRVCRLKPRRIDGKFLYYTLNRHPHLLAYDDGLNQTHLSKGGVTECPLCVPTQKAEQQKIAECLRSVDELMAAQARKVDTLKTHKRGLIQQLFPREGATKPHLRFPEFQNAGEWEERSLGNFIEEFRGKSTIQGEYEVMTSARNGLVRQRDYFDNDRITERDNIGFNVIPPNYITYRSRSDDRLFYFNENNLGITGVVSVYYPVFRVSNGSNKFLIELLSAFSRVVGKYSVGTSQTVLSLKQLGRIRLPFPPTVKEQQSIASCLSSVDALITLETKKLEALKTHKKGLMQQLFPTPEEVEA